jgi:phytoene dehydrogenase-like protein
VSHHCFDPAVSPAGKSSLIVRYDTDYDYWSALSRDAAAYAAEKARTSAAVINALEQRFPGLATAVEVIDVSTPVTWVRFTGNWRGAAEGWRLTPHTLWLSMLSGIRKTLPGLDRFYMVGQWVSGSGLPTALESGRGLVRQLCKQDRRPFVATIPANPPSRLLPSFDPEPVTTTVVLDGSTTPSSLAARFEAGYGDEAVGA